MNNQRGGILSKLFIIPIGVALMVGFFFLGYYVGKYQSKSGSQSEIVPPLPEVISKNIPQKEEFTFFKTLTDKGDKTVSINMKPQQASEQSAPAKKPTQAEEPKNKVEKKPVASEPPKNKTAATTAKEKQLEIKIEKNSSVVQQPKQTASKQPQKKENVQNASGVRYTVQIASYPDRDGAENDVKKLKKSGYAAFIVPAEIPGKGTWFRVRVGSLSKKGAAEKLQKEIQAKAGLSSIIVME